MTAKHLPTWSN